MKRLLVALAMLCFMAAAFMVAQYNFLLGGALVAAAFGAMFFDMARR